MSAPFAPCFHPTSPALRLAWDATVMKDFKDCPRRAFFAHWLGYRSRREILDLEFGKKFGAYVEAYHRIRARGFGHWDSTRAVLALVLKREESWRPDLDPDPHPNATWRNRHTLLRALGWYFLQYEHDPLPTALDDSGEPRIERHFQLPLPHATSDGVQYTWCGYIDRDVVEPSFSSPVPSDYKTTRRTLDDDYFLRFTPDLQIDGYIWAAREGDVRWTDMLVIDAIQVTPNFVRCRRHSVTRSPEQVHVWLQGLRPWLDAAERYAQAYSDALARDDTLSVLTAFPGNENACFRCAFRSVCREEPSQWPQALERDFERRPPWDPTQPRHPSMDVEEVLAA